MTLRTTIVSRTAGLFPVGLAIIGFTMMDMDFVYISDLDARWKVSYGLPSATTAAT
jgi:hypothetical protein